MPAERLQKIIAAAGIASRRKAEDLISSGRVQVNGQVVTELGSKADPDHDHIRVDGKLLHGRQKYSYILLNKPKGYVTTVSDPEHRPTVMDLVRGVRGRVYPVGRLDWASEGLLLLTNDGELANCLMKAASHVPKTYLVKIAGMPEHEKIEKLRRGVSIAEKGGRRVRTVPAKIRIIRETDNPWLEVVLTQGRNRQLRKMFEEVGHHVEKIRRVQYGPLSLDVPPGEFRELSPKEVSSLKAATRSNKQRAHL
jgi:23S rRNA pseudouridine2605 synthase